MNSLKSFAKLPLMEWMCKQATPKSMERILRERYYVYVYCAYHKLGTVCSGHTIGRAMFVTYSNG